ncbi:MAG: 50S ribosomal protein L22 [Elusimicrobia bacterium]|nr:50S ribosomal protein L22 [Elusimicrobiota bacterium]
MAEAVARALWARYAPRKVGQVASLISRKNAQRALLSLEFLPKGSSVLVKKTLESALSNLGGKLGRKVDPKEAWIKTCKVDQGPALKRIHAGSMGRAFPYKRKICHLTIVVSDEPESRSFHGTKSTA